MGGDGFVYNSQLVSYLFSLHQLHNAEYGPEDAFTLYHIVQNTSPSSSGATPALPALGHATAGAVASAATKALLYPLDLVVTRMQVQRQLRGKGEAESAAKDADAEYSGLLDAARKIYKTEGGIKAFYTGLAPEVAKGIADSFLFFLAYNVLRHYELRKVKSTHHLPVIRELAVGIGAGSLAKLVTTPIQNIVTRQQTAALVAARDPTSTTTPGQSDKLTIKDVALQIRSERGIAGFWAGYNASVLLTLNPALTFAIDNLIKRLLSKSQRENTSPHLTFLIAAVSKALATTITYPAMLAKSRAQAASPTIADEGGVDVGGVPEYLEKPNMNSTPQRRRVKQQLKKLLSCVNVQYAMWVSLRRIYRDEGLTGLYSGLEAEVLKGFLSHGLTMMTKERVHVGVIELYYLLLKLTRRWPDELRKAQQGVRDVAADAQERVVNVGETVSEGTKKLVEEGRKAAKGEN